MTVQVLPFSKKFVLFDFENRKFYFYFHFLFLKFLFNSFAFFFKTLQMAITKDDIVDQILQLKKEETPTITILQLKKFKNEIKILTKLVLQERLQQMSKKDEDEVEEKVNWNDEMIEKLLELRLKDYVVQLSGSKSNQQRSILWNSLASKFQLSYDVPINAQKLQKKYSSLKVL